MDCDEPQMVTVSRRRSIKMRCEGVTVSRLSMKRIFFLVELVKASIMESVSSVSFIAFTALSL